MSKVFQALSYVAVVVACWLIFKACNKPGTVEVVKTHKEIVRDTVVNNLAIRMQADSFLRELAVLYRINDADNGTIVNLFNENAELAGQLKLISEPVPDTCKALNKAWEDKYSKFATQTKKTTTAASNTIRGLNNTVKTQKQFLAAKDTAITKYQVSLADCLTGYKKTEPRNEINAGVSVMSGFNIQTAAGVVLGLRTKKGWQFDVGAYTNRAGTFSIRKTLFKWK